MKFSKDGFLDGCKSLVAAGKTSIKTHVDSGNDKKDRSRRWVHGYTAAGTGIVIAAVIPGMTSAALISMEAHMCYQIGKIYRGDDYTMEEAIAVAKIIGLISVAAPLVAMEALNAVPLAGWAVKGGVAGTVIKGLGEAIIAHYEKLEAQEKGIIVTDTATVIDVTATTTRQFPIAIGSSVHDRLQKIQDLLDRKLITQAEYDTKRQQILDAL